MLIFGFCIGAIVGGAAAVLFADRVIAEITDRPRAGHCRAHRHCQGCDARWFAKNPPGEKP